MSRAPTHVIVVSSNTSKIEFSRAAANDGCFAHIQLSRKSASMSAIGESDWIAVSSLVLVAHVIIRMQIDACSYDCSGGDLAAVWHDGVSSVFTLAIKLAKWEIEHRRETALRRTSTGERAASAGPQAGRSGDGSAAHRFVTIISYG